MTKTIRNIIEAARLGLCRLNQLQFEAPWNPQRRGC
jgi:hypothetical protein